MQCIRLRRSLLYQQHVMCAFLSLRRKQLIEQSRTWITADTLEARIEQALDNPIPLAGIVLPSEDQTDAPRAQTSSNGL